MGHLYENTRAYDQGRDARYYGSEREANPYNIISDYHRHKQWDYGWTAEEAMIQEVKTVKKDRIQELQTYLGMCFSEAFKKAAGEYRDEQYLERSRNF